MTKLICSIITVFTVFSFECYAQQSYQTGMNFDNESYGVVKKKAKLTRSLAVLPLSASIKQFSPAPGNQGIYSTCTAWAAAYCGRTIVDAVKNNWTDRSFITDHAYSPAFLFRLISPDDQTCSKGSYVSTAFNMMKTKGLISFNTLSAPCIPSVSNVPLSSAQNGRIKDFMRLFDVNSAGDIKIQAVKKAISERKPVVFGMICPPSFFSANGIWNPSEDADPKLGGHAMCVVGYDDNKEGGAFEIQNSWGSKWGNEGYMWIRYADFARFTPYAYEFIDLPDAKPEEADLSGSIRLVLADNSEMPVALLTSTRGLKVVPAKKTAGPLSVYQTSLAYGSGTRFRIYISNNEPAYVYAISTDLSDEVTKIFPYEDGISAALTDRRNDIAVPDEDHFIEFDDKPGKDFLCVLYSRDELNFNDLVAKISMQQGSFSERIFKVLGDQLVAPENVHFSKDKIAFEGFSKGKSIVSMMVEMDHK